LSPNKGQNKDHFDKSSKTFFTGRNALIFNWQDHPLWERFKFVQMGQKWPHHRGLKFYTIVYREMLEKYSPQELLQGSTPNLAQMFLMGS